MMESKKDTIKVESAYKTGLNLQLYNDAYDKYMRKVRFKERNTIRVESGLTFNQNQFSNWAAGGNNAMALRATLKVEHKYTARIFRITSEINGAYGMQYTDEKFRKNEDWLNLSTTPSWRFANRWDASTSLTIKTGLSNSYQAPGDTVLVAGFMAPAQILPAAGVSYKSKNGDLDLYMAPVSGNITLVLNKQLAEKGGFGMDPGKRFNAEFGGFFRLIYRKEFLNKIMTYNTKLEMFFKYTGTPTLWWENVLNIKITKVLGAKLYVLAIYNDRLETPDSKDGIQNFLQINESFGFGITYNIASKKHYAPPENLRTKTRVKR